MRAYITCIVLLLLSSNIVTLTSTAAGMDNYNLVSLSNCNNTSSEQMSDCQIGSILYHEDVLKDTAVDLRTELHFTKKGNCSYSGKAIPLNILTTQASGEKSQHSIDFLNLDKATIVHSSRMPILKSLEISTKSEHFMSQLVFPSSCTITMGIHANIPDVDSKEEAQAIIEQYSKELSSACERLEILEELRLYLPAFNVMKSLADGYLDELTEESISRIGLLNIELDTLDRIVTSNFDDADADADAAIDTSEKIQIEALRKIILKLRKMPSKYIGKTVEDFLNADELEILTAITERRDLFVTADKVGEYKSEVKRLEDRKHRAKSQLEKILEEEADDLDFIKRELRYLLNDRINGSYGISRELADMMEVPL